MNKKEIARQEERKVKRRGEGKEASANGWPNGQIGRQANERMDRWSDGETKGVRKGGRRELGREGERREERKEERKEGWNKQMIQRSGRNELLKGNKYTIKKTKKQEYNFVDHFMSLYLDVSLQNLDHKIFQLN